MKNIISCFLLMVIFVFKSYGQKQIEVSKYGFLVFTTHQEFEDYGTFLSVNSHLTVRKFQESIKFNSKGKAKYEEYGAELLNDEQQMDYTLNVDGVVEMNGTLMKPLDENRFLLTMNIENLTEESYQHLAKGEYDKATMNKIATNRPYEKKIDLFEFVKKTPSGYEETEAFEISTDKFWGYGCKHVTTCIPNAVTGDCDPYSGDYCCKYRFGIGFNCDWKNEVF